METLAYAVAGGMTGFALFYVGLFLNRWISGNYGTHAYTYVVEDFKKKIVSLTQEKNELIDSKILVDSLLKDCRNTSYLNEQRSQGLLEAKDNIIKGLELRIGAKEKAVGVLGEELEAVSKSAVELAEKVAGLEDTLRSASDDRNSLMAELEEAREESSRLESAYEAQFEDLAKAHDRIEELSISEAGLVVQVSLLKNMIADSQKDKEDLKTALFVARSTLDHIRDVAFDGFVQK